MVLSHQSVWKILFVNKGWGSWLAVCDLATASFIAATSPLRSVQCPSICLMPEFDATTRYDWKLGYFFLPRSLYIHLEKGWRAKAVNVRILDIGFGLQAILTQVSMRHWFQIRGNCLQYCLGEVQLRCCQVPWLQPRSKDRKWLIMPNSERASSSQLNSIRSISRAWDPWERLHG